MNAGDIHIGNILNDYFKEKRIRKAALGRAMGISPVVLAQNLKKPSLHLHFVIQLSHALQYNFVADIAQRLPGNLSQPDSPQLKEAQQKIAELQTEITRLHTENQLMKQLLKA